MKLVCRSAILIFLALPAVFLVAFLGASAPARAEQVGDFRLVDIFLEPTFVFSEQHQGRFDAGNSFITARWVRDTMVSASFKVGPRALMGPPARYAATAPTGQRPEEPALIEAYGQAETTYGRFRFGVVPVPFGLEGGESEPRLRFPRALFFQRAYLPLRDYGLSYYIDNAGFISEWTVHNGEAGPDLDNQTWFTARWSYHSGNDFQIGFSGSAGRSRPISTGLTEEGKTRIGNFFIGWAREKFSFELEGEVGETIYGQAINGKTTEKFRTLHADADFLLPKNLEFLARFDALDPDMNKGGNLTQELTAGLAYRGRYETSVLYLLVTKVFQEGVTPDNHVARVIWRLTPTANPRHF